MIQREEHTGHGSAGTTLQAGAGAFTRILAFAVHYPHLIALAGVGGRRPVKDDDGILGGGGVSRGALDRGDEDSWGGWMDELLAWTLSEDAR